MSENKLRVEYRHGAIADDGTRLSKANIIWGARYFGDSYYRYGRYAIKNGRFPDDHPCAPGDSFGMEMGTSESLKAFRARGYFASCFPEGDGIALDWEPEESKNAESVMRDIRECFGWDVWAEGL